LYLVILSNLWPYLVLIKELLGEIISDENFSNILLDPEVLA
jgi:hypothetical protein